MAEKRRNAQAIVVVDTDDDAAAVLALGSIGALAVAIIDGAGNQVTSFGGSGGTSMTDDAAFTAATSSFNPVGGIVTSDSVDSGDGGAFAMLANRQQKVTLYDSGGVELAVGGGTQYTEDAAAAANPVGNAINLIRVDTPAGAVTTDGDNVALRGTNFGAAYVTILDASGAEPSFGGGTQYTQGDTDASITGTAFLMEGAADTLLPVQGTVADGLLVNLGSNNDVTVTGNVAVTNAGLTALNGAIAGSEVQVDVLTLPAITGTVDLGATDNAVLDAIAASVAAIDTDATTIIGHVDGIEALLATIDADTSTLAGAVSGTEMQVDVLTMPTVTVNAHAVTNAGTFAVQVDGTALTRLTDIETNTDSGAVVGNGAAATAQRVTLANDSTGIIATVGAVTAITNALPAGTNAIGKLAANSGVDIGDVTLTAGTAAIGTLLPPDIDVTTHTNYAKKYYTSTGAATDGIVWSPAAGKRWHVVSMFIGVSAACTVTLEDDKSGGDEAVWKHEFAANGGMTINWSEKYPFASGEDAADLIVTTSAGNIYITCTGYEI